MALQADLATMSLPDLLQWLYNAEATGNLRFRHPSGDVQWQVAAGKLVHVDSGGLDLWAASQVGEDAWRKARQWAQREHTTPARILAKVGLIDTSQVAAWITEAGKRTLHQMLLWDEGWFVFEEAKVRASQGVPVEHMLLDVAREMDERDEVKERFENSLVWIEAVPGADLGEVEPGLADLLTQGVHLVELPWLLAADAWEATKAVAALVKAGKVLAIPATPDRVEDPLRAYQDAVIRERSFRFEEAAALFEGAIDAAWGDSYAQEAVGRWTERYFALVRQHLIADDRELAPAGAAQPAAGDPYAAYVLRSLNEPRTLGDLVAACPFHRFYSIRAARRLAAAGDIIVRPAAKGGSA